MKRLLIIGVLVFIVVSLISGVAINNQKSNISEDKLQILLRNIGHQLLLTANDTTSRVLPINKINENQYQIAFQNSFAFKADTLIKIVTNEFKNYNLNKHYTVNVKECLAKQTVFAYEIDTKKGNLAPCLGRTLDESCYLINITFVKQSFTLIYLWSLLLLPLLLIGIYFKRFSLKNKPKEVTLMLQNEINPIFEIEDSILIGKYTFIENLNKLQFENKTIELTEKENKALSLFIKNKNIIIERAVIMKEIWENDGVFVISRNVDVLISKLRKKLQYDPALKIINIPGKGYKLVDS